MLVYFALGNAKVLSFALADAKVPNAISFAFWWNIGFRLLKKSIHWAICGTCNVIVFVCDPTFLQYVHTNLPVNARQCYIVFNITVGKLQELHAATQIIIQAPICLPDL